MFHYIIVVRVREAVKKSISLWLKRIAVQGITGFSTHSVTGGEVGHGHNRLGIFSGSRARSENVDVLENKLNAYRVSR
ncbi:MAG: hypothetical protein JRE23_14215 [Deltaproteobacteria bacterium]|nr:hypothetical protein [Deltaproteobacteria bacterium]